KLGTLIHHQAKEIESQLRIYRELTCAARVIDDAATAAASVDEVVRTVWREQRPGYVEIHRDMVERPIPVPRAIIEWDGALHFGPLSPPPIVKRVDRADLVLNLGTLLTDMNLGSRPPQITRDRSIWAVGGRVNVSFHTYTDVHIRDFVHGLRRAPLRRHREN